MALKHLKKHEANPPKTAAEAKKIKLAVAKAVSDHLGNTPTVAIASYIDPTVWGKLEKF
jgi:DNA topoisomerase IB